MSLSNLISLSRRRYGEGQRNGIAVKPWVSLEGPDFNLGTEANSRESFSKTRSCCAAVKQILEYHSFQAFPSPAFHFDHTVLQRAPEDHRGVLVRPDHSP